MEEQFHVLFLKNVDINIHTFIQKHEYTGIICSYA